MQKHADIVKQMTREQKAALCDGKDFWNLKGVEALGLSEIMVCDGPHGLRKHDSERRKLIPGGSVPAVCFPPACTSACSWEPHLLREMGEALGDACLSEGVSVLLGPGVNMKRSPLCGRNFEYFSEDPLLAGELAAAFTQGVQSKGVGTSLKHFAANNQETRRMTVSAVVDERALREIYLSAFERVVKKSKPWTVMNAYNRLNGTHCSENKGLQTDILRGEWGFDGLVVSDWGAVNDRVAGIKAGNDLEMPSSGGENTKRILDALNSGELDESELDICVGSIVDLILKSQESMKDSFFADKDEQHKLARKIAGRSMVLLKNDGAILPISKNKRLAVIGEMAVYPRFQGAGSSLINPTKVDCAVDCLLDEGYDLKYYRGYNKNKDKVDTALMFEAVTGACSADVVIIFAGLTEGYESEGFDRRHMRMPRSHDELIKAVASVNKNIVVVLAGGAPVSMPWIDDVKGVLNSGLGGQAGAGAVADIICGRVNPSGKLAETYPICGNCAPCKNFFPGGDATVEYRESVYIGYRYYERAGKKVRFPFGFGLSYTTFQYSGLTLNKTSMNDTDILELSFFVKNTGSAAGAETAQIYVADKESTIHRPVKELAAFMKVDLQPGETKKITISLDKRAFAFYNVKISDWHVESGDFEICVGSSAADIHLCATVNVKSSLPEAEIPDYRASAPLYYTADVKNLPAAQFEAVLGHKLPPSQKENARLDFTSNIEDAKDTKWGGRVNRAVIYVSRAANKGERGGMAETLALQTPIRNFVSMSGGLFSKKMADGFIKFLSDDEPAKGVGMVAAGVPRLVKNLGGLLKKI